MTKSKVDNGKGNKAKHESAKDTKRRKDGFESLLNTSALTEEEQPKGCQERYGNGNHLSVLAFQMLHSGQAGIGCCVEQHEKEEKGEEIEKVHISDHVYKEAEHVRLGKGGWER